MPFLAIHGAADSTVAPARSRRVFAGDVARSKTIHTYEAMRDAPFRDLGRELAFADIGA